MSGRANTVLFFGILLAAVSVSAQEIPGSRERLTLMASLERAVQNNPQVLLAKKDLSVAQTRLRQARSLYYPKLNLNLDYVRYRNETVGLTSPELGNIVLEAPIEASRSDSRGNPLSQNLYLGRLGLVQTLYSGGKIAATHKLSRATVRRAENLYDTTRKEVEFETAQNFFRLLAIRSKERAIDDSKKDAAQLLIGSSGHAKLAVQVFNEDFRQKRALLQKDEEEARFAYLRSIGVELFGFVDVEGPLEYPGSRPDDLQTALVWAKDNRAELKENQIQKEADQLSVELSLAERYPVFLLGAGYEVRDDEFPVRDNNWNAGLAMTIPLFDGFSSIARVKESRYRADQGRLRAVQLEDQIELEVRSTFNDCQRWADEVEARDKEVATLEGVRRNYFSSRPSAGNVAQQLDYLRWSADAEVNLIEARYQLAVARARLAKATGKPLDAR